MALIACLLVAALAPRPTLGADPPACVFDAATGVATLAQTGVAAVARGGNGLRPDDPLLFNGEPCGDATMASTESIDAAGSGSQLHIDLTNGPLAPGRTDEPGDSDEIEIGWQGARVTRVTVQGGPANETFVEHHSSISLNGFDGDGDVGDTFWATVVLDGGDGDDALMAVAEDGSVFRSDVRFRGGPGDDELHGGMGQDQLDGGPGADALDGGRGRDVLRGGPGDDRIDGGAGEVPMAAPDDVMDFSSVGGAIDVDLAAGVAVADGEGGRDVVARISEVVGGSGADRIRGASAHEVLRGGAGDDDVGGGGGDDDLHGGEGADALHGGAGADDIEGGPGTDVHEGGGDGPDIVRTEAERRVEAHSDGARLVYVDGAREEERHAGFERVHVQGEGSAIFGSSGSDDFIAHAATVHLGPGDDRLSCARCVLDYADSPAGVRMSEGGRVVADGHGSTDVIRTPDSPGTVNTGPVWSDVRGSRHDDVLTGETLTGGDGDDRLTGRTLAGGAGDDQLTGERLNGGAGADVLVSTGAPSELRGGPGPDRLDGGRDGRATARFDLDAEHAARIDLAAGIVFDDGTGSVDTITGVRVVHGTPYDDVLVGSDRAEQLHPLAGDDRVSAGGGDDEIRTSPGRDSIDGGPGTDRYRAGVEGHGQTSALHVDLRTGEVARDGHRGADADIAGIEGVSGTGYDDVLLGDGGPNWFDGVTGTDRIEGGAGDDRLNLTAGVVVPGAGSDIVGGRPNYVPEAMRVSYAAAAGPLAVTCGEGYAYDVDRYFAGHVVEPDGATDTLLEVGVVEGTRFADVMEAGLGCDAIDGGDGDDLLTAQARGGSDLRGGAGNDVLRGGTGDDRLDGGAGTDTLLGGAGDDDVRARDGADDRLECGDGTDRGVADALPLDAAVGCEALLRPSASEPPAQPDPRPNPAGPGDPGGADEPVAPTHPEAPPADRQSASASSSSFLPARPRLPEATPSPAGRNARSAETERGGTGPAASPKRADVRVRVDGRHAHVRSSRAGVLRLTLLRRSKGQWIVVRRVRRTVAAHRTAKVALSGRAGTRLGAGTYRLRVAGPAGGDLRQVTFRRAAGRR